MSRTSRPEAWDLYFRGLAEAAALLSRDKTTKLGAVVVRDRVVLATGFNGFPRGVWGADEKRYERPEKYFWTEHAERNAIYCAARVGHALQGGTLYCRWLPCVDCARAVIQAGIQEIVYWEGTPERWAENMERSWAMFKETGTRVRRLA